MARTSRKGTIRAAITGGGQQTPEPSAPVVWNAGGYARLSVLETRDREDGEALSVQKALLESFIRGRPELRFRELYEDNGETGTNFDRSGFRRMMDDVRAGRINCIVVKDLSRFGRDYLETGNYLEHILPYLGVRFISIHDGYDSEAASSEDALKTALKNLVNQVYSMDISRKTCSVLREKQRRGEFTGSIASYGYLKDPEDRHRMIVDPETAPVVREIFERRAAGESYAAIARWLNASEIPAPNAYRYRKGLLKDGRCAGGSWRTQTIRRILSNPVYLGHTVQGRRRSEFYAGRPDYRVEPSEWLVVKNTHEPVVTREQFERARELAGKRREAYQRNLGKYDALGTEENLFPGLVFCGDCGGAMTRYKQVSHGRKVSYAFICRNYAVNLDKSGCSYKFLRFGELKAAVLALLGMEIGLAAEARQISEREQRARLARSGKLRRTERDLSRLEQRKERAIRDLLSGSLRQEEYERARELQEREREALSGRMQEEGEALERISGNFLLRALRDSAFWPELTKKLIRTMVKRVTVYEGGRVELQLNYRDARLDAVRQREENPV